MSKIRLTKIDLENWRFVLYETPDKIWIGDFVYSPQSFMDISMLIKLTEVQQKKARQNRSYLIELSDEIRNNYKDYLEQALDRNMYLTK